MLIPRLPFLLTLLVPAGASAQAETDLGSSLGLQLDKLRALETPGSELLEKIGKLTDAPASSLKRAGLFRGTQPDGKTIRLCRLPIADENLGAAVAFAVDGSGKHVAAAVLDSEGKPVREWQPLLQQFKWRPIPTLATAKPQARIEAERVRTAKSDKSDDKLTHALIRLMGHMQDQAAMFNVPRPRSKKLERKLIVQLRDAYRGVASLEADLAPLLGKQADKFGELATRSADMGSKVLAAFDDGDMARVRREGRALTRSCRACHNLEGLKVPGKLKDASRAKRTELGIGDGYLLIGYDIRVAHADRAKAQRVLDFVRQAVLLLDASTTTPAKGHRVAIGDALVLPVSDVSRTSAMTAYWFVASVLDAAGSRLPENCTRTTFASAVAAGGRSPRISRPRAPHATRCASRRDRAARLAILRSGWEPDVDPGRHRSGRTFARCSEEPCTRWLGPDPNSAALPECRGRVIPAWAEVPHGIEARMLAAASCSDRPPRESSERRCRQSHWSDAPARIAESAAPACSAGEGGQVGDRKGAEPVAAQRQFEELSKRGLAANADTTTATATGDVDGDGDLDLVVGNSRGYGTGTFTERLAAR